jgi:hypothetical protein
MEKSILCSDRESTVADQSMKKSAGMLTNCCPVALNRWPAGMRQNVAASGYVKIQIRDAAEGNACLNAGKLSSDALFVAAAEGCVRCSSCSSCRACEAAFGCVAVVKPELALHQADRVDRIHDCCAAERSLAGSTAATDRH